MHGIEDDNKLFSSKSKPTPPSPWTMACSAQGPDRQPDHIDEALLSSIPGQWLLLLDEGGKYEFSAPEKQQQQQAAATRTEGSADERGGERNEGC